jgi:hypothetical protein
MRHACLSVDVCVVFVSVGGGNASAPLCPRASHAARTTMARHTASCTRLRMGCRRVIHERSVIPAAVVVALRACHCHRGDRRAGVGYCRPSLSFWHLHMQCQRGWTVTLVCTSMHARTCTVVVAVAGRLAGGLEVAVGRSRLPAAWCAQLDRSTGVILLGMGCSAIILWTTDQGLAGGGASPRANSVPTPHARTLLRFRTRFLTLVSIAFRASA